MGRVVTGFTIEKNRTSGHDEKDFMSSRWIPKAIIVAGILFIVGGFFVGGGSTFHFPELLKTAESRPERSSQAFSLNAFLWEPIKKLLAFRPSFAFLRRESSEASVSVPTGPREKTPEERLREALERSKNVKGVYMTHHVANGNYAAADKLRGDIVTLLDTTELNGVVIDVKETDGVFLDESLKNFIAELHQKNVWVIARLVVFNDTAQAKAVPGMALKRTNGKLWLDNRGNGWLDPASHETWDYIVGIGTRAIDYGFDEIQFDYIRFPSDGDTENIVYPVYSPKTQKRADVMREFFAYLSRALKNHKPDIILSVDLFGYVAIQPNDLGVGQRMEDIGNAFDYISFMLYPSHYYSGFYVDADAGRGLPALAYPYRAANIASVASSHPYDVVYRSLLIAQDFLAGKNVFEKATTTSVSMKSGATTTPTAEAAIMPRSRARLRPWLQDFDLGVDSSRGIYYDAAKVRQEIDAAEGAGASGWLLWSARNVYTKEALKVDGGM